MLRESISIHALHEESDCTRLTLVRQTLQFQSTLSMRRATRANYIKRVRVLFQSTLSMRRATRPRPDWSHSWRISIHALHEESDPAIRSETAMSSAFQSTLSMRRATSTCATCPTTIGAFQSTLSMRRATIARKISSVCARFQSTLSMRRATPSPRHAGVDNNFNPRSP